MIPDTQGGGGYRVLNIEAISIAAMPVNDQSTEIYFLQSSTSARNGPSQGS
jgi:hypothetical protein